MKVGVLAVQGAFAEMETYWRGKGAETFEIRQLADLERSMDLLATAVQPEVEILSTFNGLPTSVRHRNITAFTWHPELQDSVLSASR